jgi:hypothetical protein
LLALFKDVAVFNQMVLGAGQSRPSSTRAAAPL